MTTSPTPHSRLFVRWFVQYNPMFTASALCVLGGVLLLSCAMGAGADVGLTAVLQLYQALVIGVAALLYRRLLERRPGAILGVIALVFLVDPTLQLGALAASEQTLASALWVVLFALKWRALEWAFRLRFSTSLRVLPPLAAALVTLVPNARVLGVGDDVLPAALAACTFAFGLAFAFLKPSVTSRTALGDVGNVMFPRLVKAAAWIGAGGALYQCWNATLAIGVRALLPALGAVALVVAVKTAHEAKAWALVAAAAPLFVAGGARDEVFVHLGLPLIAVALLLTSRNKEPRLFTAGVLASVASIVLPRLNGGLHVLSADLVVAGAVATGALVFVLVQRRGFSAIPALAVLHVRTLGFAATFAPHGGLQWGGLLLVAGFVLLPAGVVLHRRLSRVLALDALAVDAEAREGGPSSPAGIGTAIGTAVT